MTKDYWINVYQGRDGVSVYGIPHRTKERATDAISSGLMRLAYRIHVRFH